MKISEQADKLNEALLLCNIHYQRMKYAFEKVVNLFPLDTEKYANLDPDTFSYLDQLIYRFSKLQDSMGKRLFPALLGILGEDTLEIPFIDILTKLEKFGLLENFKDWLSLRETRNVVTHEYPFFTEEIIEGLNIMEKQCTALENTWLKLKAYAENRIN
jgi:hypothetical protein